MFSKDVIRLIAKKCDLKTQIKCRLLNKYWYSALNDVYLPSIECNLNDYFEYNEFFHPEEEFNYVEKDLKVNSFEINDVSKIYMENVSVNWETWGSLLGKTNNLYFYFEDSGGGTPGCCEWQKRELIFSKKLINLIRFGLTESDRKQLLKRYNKIKQ